MPITFKSRHSPNIIMLDGVGRELIRMMGHSGSVPGSIPADEVAAALAALEGALARGREASLKADRQRGDEDEDGDREKPISAHHRALPLIEMLRAAAREGDYVLWEG